MSKIIRSKGNLSSLPTGHRIALYIRVSTEEQAENPEGSIKSQEQRLRTYIQFKNQEGHFGEITTVYIDRARSGKDTNRPELQRMLQAIQRQEITLLLVTELSRLSRSIKDFCSIWDLMRSHGCEFQSLREQFDTTTAAGEMVLYTIANIAQFERRQVSERVLANLQARASRGLYNGGIVPIGYKLDPDRKGYLLVDPGQAEVVRAAFRFFLQEGSLTQAAKRLNQDGYRLTRNTQGGGYRPRLGHFTIGNLHTILRNKAYLGVRVYQVKAQTKEARASWEAIIDADTFERAQELLRKNHCRKKPDSPQRYPFLLSGLTFCSTCGERLAGKSAHGNGGKIPYYDHSWTTKRQGCLEKKEFNCRPNRVLAKKLEPAVWEAVESILTHPSLASRLLDEARKVYEQKSQTDESKTTRTAIHAYEQQLEALAERIAQLPKELSAGPLFKQMEKIEALKRKEEECLTLQQGKALNAEAPAELAAFDQFLNALRKLKTETDAQEIRSKIAQRLIHRVEITPESFRLHFYVGENHVNRELASAGSPFQLKPQKLKKLPEPYSGSNSLHNGWGTRIRT